MENLNKEVIANDITGEVNSAEVNSVNEGITESIENSVEVTESHRKCIKCGADMSSSQVFCSACGANNSKEKNKKGGKKLLVAIIAAIAVICLATLSFTTILPKAFGGVERYLEKGNYQKAYSIAKGDDEKLKVVAENAAAYCSAITVDNLKDPDSFQLRDCFYNENIYEDGEFVIDIVLEVSAKNSYGGRVSNFWLYSWDDDESDIVYINSFSDLDDEEESEYDDADEKLEKTINNIHRIIVRRIVSSGIHLEKSALKRINKMFENNTLENVELIDTE